MAAGVGPQMTRCDNACRQEDMMHSRGRKSLIAATAIFSTAVAMIAVPNTAHARWGGGWHGEGWHGGGWRGGVAVTAGGATPAAVLASRPD